MNVKQKLEEIEQLAAGMPDGQTAVLAFVEAEKELYKVYMETLPRFEKSVAASRFDEALSWYSKCPGLSASMAPTGYS